MPDHNTENGTGSEIVQSTVSIVCEAECPRDTYFRHRTLESLLTKKPQVDIKLHTIIRPPSKFVKSWNHFIGENVMSEVVLMFGSIPFRLPTESCFSASC